MWTSSQFIAMALLVVVRTQASENGPPTSNPSLEFHCSDNDNINVNLTSTNHSYYNALWTCDDGMPKAVAVTTNREFIATCSKGNNVTVTLLQSSSSTPIPSETPSRIIKKEIKTFVFQCTDIKPSGIVLFTDTSLNDTMPVSYMGTKKPEFHLQMYVTAGISESTHVKSITIGRKYKLHIDGPDNYQVIPSKCYAADVSSGATGDRNVTLLKNGCPCDINIFEANFTAAQPGNLGKVEVPFSGFRFVGSINVYLECEVHVCPSSGCQLPSPTPATCSSVNCHDQSTTDKTGERKRRSVSKQNSIAIARTSFVVHNSRMIVSSAIGTEPVSTLIIICGLFFWTITQRF